MAFGMVMSAAVQGLHVEMIHVGRQMGKQWTADVSYGGISVFGSEGGI